jgi:hypothetical protein
MRNTSIMLVMLASLLAVAGGCITREQPYKCCSDLAVAHQRADLVVSGTVTEIKTLAHHMGPEVKTEAFGVIGTECLADEEVTMTLISTEKGTPPATLTFQYNAPCFHPAKGFSLHYTEPTLLQGDKAKVYLVKHGQVYWMVAHELQNPQPSDEGRKTLREEIY